jgi:hypothetical protein
MCSGDYIFQIDADELPNEILIENLHTILENNQTLDGINIPKALVPYLGFEKIS